MAEERTLGVGAIRVKANTQTVVAAVYRPCCGNSTVFPDCNHGMLDFAAIDPHRVVSRDIFSLPGAPSMQQWLAGRGRLGQRQETGGACGV